MALAHDQDGLLWAAEFRTDPNRLGTSLNRFGLSAGPALSPVPAVFAAAFARYFAGELQALESFATGRVGSRFEQAVWTMLRSIPPGETRSYGDIARALGGAATGSGPNARSVGTANGRNPLAIVVPCHRVIGADGRLTGYAGGLETKAWLLAHEGWRGSQATLF
jgi:methylated-DNA-[protein]-cysteine S-methyltransferase